MSVHHLVADNQRFDPRIRLPTDVNQHFQFEFVQPRILAQGRSGIAIHACLGR